jgi:hypothetical protein
MEQNRDEEIENLKRLLIELENRNNKMFYELRELNIKLSNIIHAPKSDTIRRDVVEEIKVESELKKEAIIDPVEETKLVEEIKSVEEVITPVSVEKKVISEEKVLENPVSAPVQEAIKPIQKQAPIPPKPSKTKQDWERFIGENLINKIGILITVIGVAIGTKYAIDKELLTPAMRIALGYAVGAGLLIFALKLKAKYLDFSAVLLSGAMSIFYFVSYIAFSFYHFFPTSLTFILMLIFTGFTVFSAIKYEKQIIAHLGLVGAYAVPFLLSDGSGKIGFFFSYITIINLGILIISFLRNWKPLQYVSYAFTWIIFFSWFLFSYDVSKHFNFSVIFVFIFFLIFYLTGLAYKVLKHEKFNVNDVFFILGNSFIFFGLGYSILASNSNYENYLGVFCVFNALVHFTVSVILYRNKLVDKTIFYLTAGMVLLFVTITIPIQFDGDVITITWTFEALMLFLLGRIKSIKMFELMSYPVYIVAFFSLCFFWQENYGRTILEQGFWYLNDNLRSSELEKIKIELSTSFLFNMKFFSTFCFVFAMASVYYFNNIKNNIQELTNRISKIFNIISIFLVLIPFFVGIFLEINNYWELKIIDFRLGLGKNFTYFDHSDYQILRSFALTSKLAFSLVYIGILQFFRTKKQNSPEFNYTIFVLSSLLVLLFLIIGIYEMRFLKFSQINSAFGSFSNFTLVAARIGMYLIFAGFIYSFIRFIKNQLITIPYQIFASFLVLFVIFLCSFLEIKLFWDVKELTYKISGQKEILKFDHSIFSMMKSFGLLSKIGFTLLFLGIVSFFNTKKEKTYAFKTLIFAASCLTILLYFIFTKMEFQNLEVKNVFTNSDYYSNALVKGFRILIYLLFAGFIIAFIRFIKAQIKPTYLKSFLFYLVHGVIFVSIFMEINLYWEIKEIAFKNMCRLNLHRIDTYNLSLLKSFALISKLAFGLVFFGITLFLRNKKENDDLLKNEILVLSTIIIPIFLTFGLYNFSFLQLNFLHAKNEYFVPYSLVLVRYLMYGLFTVYMFNYLRFLKKQFTSKFFIGFSEFMLHISLLWIVSSELVNWMHVFNSNQVYKLALSILWGIYSLSLIAYGIWKKKSHLRIGAISLFAVTLIKLFVYDLQHMSTISKTIVFIALGVLLLIISFLYNKYKSSLFEENEK